VECAHGALRAHRHGHDLLDIHHAAFLDLHGGFDGVCVEGIEVLLTASIEALGIRVHALLDSGVRDLLHQDANLQEGAP
jgi:hypothetical protein